MLTGLKLHTDKGEFEVVDAPGSYNTPGPAEVWLAPVKIPLRG
jgi:hypothetical protein